jgi:hypothetical protein
MAKKSNSSPAVGAILSKGSPSGKCFARRGGRRMFPAEQTSAGGIQKSCRMDYRSPVPAAGRLPAKKYSEAGLPDDARDLDPTNPLFLG